MKYLQQSPRDPNVFRYRDAPEGSVVDVEIEYTKGSSPRNRGIYLSITPKTVADGAESFNIFAGKRVRIITLARSSPRLLRRMAEAADERVPSVAAKYREGDDTSVFDELLAALQPIAESETAARV
jgi:hypothetical protein